MTSDDRRQYACEATPVDPSPTVRQLAEATAQKLWQWVEREDAEGRHVTGPLDPADLIEAAILDGRKALEAQLVDQRSIGHGEGQRDAIADVNAGRIDDLIAPRLASLMAERDEARALNHDYNEAVTDTNESIAAAEKALNIDGYGTHPQRIKALAEQAKARLAHVMAALEK